MNSSVAKPLTGNAFRSVTQKKLLPVKAQLSIPGGLDWVIKQRLTSVIAYTLIDAKYSVFEVKDLCLIDRLLSQEPGRDIHNVVLYGYELSTLLSFLIEQQKQYHAWSVGLVPDRAKRTIEAELHNLVPKLRSICRQIDILQRDPLVNAED